MMRKEQTGTGWNSVHKTLFTHHLYASRQHCNCPPLHYNIIAPFNLAVSAAEEFITTVQKVFGIDKASLINPTDILGDEPLISFHNADDAISKFEVEAFHAFDLKNLFTSKHISYHSHNFTPQLPMNEHPWFSHLLLGATDDFLQHQDDAATRPCKPCNPNKFGCKYGNVLWANNYRKNPPP